LYQKKGKGYLSSIYPGPRKKRLLGGGKRRKSIDFLFEAGEKSNSVISRYVKGEKGEKGGERKFCHN